MKQELLTDIELDIQQMKYLVDAISKEATPALQALLKRNILQLQGRLDGMLIELGSVSQIADPREPIQQKSMLQSELEAPALSIPETSAIRPPVIDAPLVSEEVKEDVISSVLGENIWISTDFRRSISLNDSFRFVREIFDGDSELMNRVVDQISAMSTLNAAVVFLSSKVKIDEEQESMSDFLELLKKHFKSA